MPSFSYNTLGARQKIGDSQNVARCSAAGGKAKFDAQMIFRIRKVEHVEMSVSRAGQVVGTGDYRLAYQEIQPNGPGGEPVCLSAMRDTLIINP